MWIVSVQKDCLEGIIKHLLVFVAPYIILIGQLQKDVGLRLRVTNIFLQLTNKYDISCEKDE